MCGRSPGLPAPCCAWPRLASRPSGPPRTAPLPARPDRYVAAGDDRVAVTRVAMLAPIAWPTPPRGYGPWEQVVATLSDALVDLGVDVTLYATGDSRTRASLRWVAAHGYEEDPSYDVKVYEALHIARVFEEAGEHDIIHNHFDFLPLAWSRLVKTPLVTTIHGFSSASILPAYRAYDDRAHYVAISNADRHPDL